MPAPKGHPNYDTEGLAGRPKKYTEEFIEKEADVLVEWTKNNSNIFIEDFCYQRGYHEARISEFQKENERFSEAYSMFKMRQKVALFKASISKKSQFSGIALILGHCHGIYSKTEQKLSGDCVNPLSFIVSTNDGKTKNLIEDDNDE